MRKDPISTCRTHDTGIQHDMCMYEDSSTASGVATPSRKTGEMLSIKDLCPWNVRLRHN